MEVIRYDARGHGMSEATTSLSDFTYESFALDLVSLLDGLGVSDYWLGGASLGAATVMHAALLLDQPPTGLVIALPPRAWDGRRELTNDYAAMAMLPITRSKLNSTTIDDRAFPSFRKCSEWPNPSFRVRGPTTIEADLYDVSVGIQSNSYDVNSMLEYDIKVELNIYVDNGSIYTSMEINQICIRIGCMLCHAPVRDGAAKGKVERFFRTVRESFLIRKLDLTSVAELNRSFTSWVEDEYNAKEHSVLKMRPIDRFGLDLPRIKFLPPHQVNDELFFVEQDRKVNADNTFSLKAIRFEAPRDLRSKTIQVRFSRSNFEQAIVYYKGERMGRALEVDLVANDRKPRDVAEVSP